MGFESITAKFGYGLSSYYGAGNTFSMQNSYNNPLNIGVFGKVGSWGNLYFGDYGFSSPYARYNTSWLQTYPLNIDYSAPIFSNYGYGATSNYRSNYGSTNSSYTPTSAISSPISNNYSYSARNYGATNYSSSSSFGSLTARSNSSKGSALPFFSNTSKSPARNYGAPAFNSYIAAADSTRWTPTAYRTDSVRSSVNLASNGVYQKPTDPKAPNKGTGITTKANWSKMSDEEIYQVYGNNLRDITQPYTGTAAQLDKYFEKTGRTMLKGKGHVFIEAQNKYGINAAVLASMSVAECGGDSPLARRTNNVLSIMGSGPAYVYSSVDACIMDAASKLKNSYVGDKTRSLRTISQINAKYCPVQDKRDHKHTNYMWAYNVTKILNSIEAVV